MIDSLSCILPTKLPKSNYIDSNVRLKKVKWIQMNDLIVTTGSSVSRPDISFHHMTGSVIVITRDRGVSGKDTSKVEDGKICYISFTFYQQS